MRWASDLEYAIDAVEYIISGHCTDTQMDYIPEIKAVLSAAKKQIPKKLRETTSTKRCPSCNKQVSNKGNIHRNYRFCRWCGQALDWSETT